MSDADRPHSERYFTDARDHWWHEDYLALMAKRLALPESPSILEVGTGQGHFARAWAPHFPSGFSFVGLDPEERSLVIARARTESLRMHRSLEGTFEFIAGRAESLPFEDDSFDLVMCQTLLIHLADPRRGFDEMVRICRPGGVILACEPNNLAAAQRLALLPDDTADPFIELRFAWRCTRGKARLGLGDNNYGIRLPELFSLLDTPEYAMNDRPWVMAPPYSRIQETAHLADLDNSIAEQVYGWERDEARRYYVAGGGEPNAFERDYETLLASQSRERDAVVAGQWVELNGPAMLVAWGRKPA
jgi:SAM-dependent methyltransferase